ncbi:Apolipoprotein [Ceratobasidium sp. AG-Ba]|nr:Apolipoprotein [Ceratobasidium sp. AG-Ba]
MSMLLPSSDSSRIRLKRRRNTYPPDRDSVLYLENLNGTPLGHAEVQVEHEERLEITGEGPDVEHKQRDTPEDGNSQTIDSLSRAPDEPEEKYRTRLKEAQEEWARRRQKGFEDYGAEMAKEAKIWKVYVNETDKADDELVDGWNKSLDVLLIFAALFSAISTAFAGISTQYLQQDPADKSAQALLTISQALVEISNNRAMNSSLVANSEPPVFKPSRTAVIVNTLWFLSLSLSVAVSLIAMLAKEWCHAFISGRTGEIYERARLRQKRWNEIERLRMVDVLTLLPLLMHLALLLFAIGLCVYLWDINTSVAIPVVIVTSIGTFIYISTIVHSLTAENCPYTTASSKLAKSYIKTWLTSPAPIFATWTRRVVKTLDSSGLIPSFPKTRKWIEKYNVSPRLWLVNVRKLITSSVDYQKTLGAPSGQENEYTNNVVYFISEPHVAEDPQMDIITSHMLSWLLKNCHDSKIIDSVIVSLAGAQPWLPRLPLLESDALATVFCSLDRAFEYNPPTESHRLRPNCSAEMASLCVRALHFLLTHYHGDGFIVVTTPKPHVRNTWSQDLYPRSLGEMAARLEESGVAFNIEKFSDASDTTVFWQIFSLAISSEEDPLVRHHDFHHEMARLSLQHHIDNDVVLHPAAIIAIVRQITRRLCLPKQYWQEDMYEPYELCCLLVQLYVHSESHENHSDVQHSISVGLGAATLNFGEYPGWIRPPGCNFTRAEEFVTHHTPPRAIAYCGKTLSFRHSRKLEKARLLEFGLLGLLESPFARHFTASDLFTWNKAYTKLHDGYMADHIFIHTLPRVFSFGAHVAQVATKYITQHINDGDFVSCRSERLECLSTVCQWNLSTADDTIDDHRAVHSVLLELLCKSEATNQHIHITELLRYAFTGCSTSCIESFSNNVLHLLLQASLSGDRYQAPTAMSHLWRLLDQMLPQAERSSLIESLLRSVIQPESPIPTSMDELGLAREWSSHIQAMSDDHPRELLDSGILSLIYYSIPETVVDDRPSLLILPRRSNSGSERTAYDVKSLIDKCTQAKNSEDQGWRDLPFDTESEGQ